MAYAVILALTLLVNIPFGYLRGNQRKFSLLWFLYIHLPVPIIILIRNYYDIDHSWTFTPFLVIFYVSGQQFGKMIYNHRKKILGKSN